MSKSHKFGKKITKFKADFSSLEIWWAVALNYTTLYIKSRWYLLNLCYYFFFAIFFYMHAIRIKISAGQLVKILHFQTYDFVLAIILFNSVISRNFLHLLYSKWLKREINIFCQQMYFDSYQNHWFFLMPFFCLVKKKGSMYICIVLLSCPI